MEEIPSPFARFSEESVAKQDEDKVINEDVGVVEAEYENNSTGEDIQEQDSGTEETSLDKMAVESILHESHINKESAGDEKKKEKHVTFADSEPFDVTVFWKNHDSWKEKGLKEKVFSNVSVSDPQCASRTLRNPNPSVYYSIKAEDFEAPVRRRYSDFLWLKEILQSRYIGMVIPPLPPKVSGSSQHFLNLRMRGLTLFLEKIVANLYLKYDSTVFAFFTEGSGEQWEALKKETRAYQQRAENIGHQKWIQALSNFELPSDAKNVLFDVNKQVIDLSRQLEKILQAAQALSSGSHQYVAAVEEFDNKFQDFLISEMISTAPTSIEENKFNDFPEGELESASNLEKLTASIRDLSFVGRYWNENIATTSEIVDFKIYEAIRFELGLVRQLRDLMKRRKDIIKLHDKSVQKKIVHERERKLAEHNQQLDIVNKLDKKIAEDSDRVKNTYDHAIFITKGLFFSGVRHFSKVKSERIESLRSEICIAFKAYHNNMERVWASQLQTG